jgi:hypothetical protein
MFPLPRRRDLQGDIGGGLGLIRLARRRFDACSVGLWDGHRIGGGYHGRTQHDARPNGRSYKPAVADQSETSPKQASLHITWCTFDMDSLIAQQGPQISCSALWVDHAIISRRRQASGQDKFHAVLIITGVNSCWIRRFLSPADSPSREPRCKPFAILYAV